MSDSLAKLQEAKIVSWLLEAPYFRDAFFNIAGMPSPAKLQTLECVSLTDIPPGEHRGDIDVLAIECGRPAAAIAIQAKVVRAQERAFDTDGNPNGLRGLAEGVRQANLLATVGFAQVYLYVLVLVDSRRHNADEGRGPYGGLTPRLHARIYGDLSPPGLAQGVGFVTLELVQSSDELSLVGLGDLRCRDSLATARRQPDTLTRWVEQKFLAPCTPEIH